MRKMTLAEWKNKEKREMIDKMLDYCCHHNDDLAFTFYEWLRENLHHVYSDDYSAIKFDNHEYKFELFNGYSWGKISEYHDHLLMY
ncbi:MAG: hypothetical protein ACOX1F_01030 [Erysipelotrichaceae bacterium]|jgi:hypothetical protein